MRFMRPPTRPIENRVRFILLMVLAWLLNSGLYVLFILLDSEALFFALGPLFAISACSAIVVHPTARQWWKIMLLMAWGAPWLFIVRALGWVIARGDALMVSWGWIQPPTSQWLFGGRSLEHFFYAIGVTGILTIPILFLITRSRFVAVVAMIASTLLMTVIVFDGSFFGSKVIDSVLLLWNPAIVAGLIWWAGRARLEYVPPAGICPHCQYDLTGLNSPSICPECGHAITSPDSAESPSSEAASPV